MTEYVGTRISAQVRSHAQKVLPDYRISNRVKRVNDSDISCNEPIGDISHNNDPPKSTSPYIIEKSQRSFTMLGKRKSPNSESHKYQNKRPRHDQDDSMSYVSSVLTKDIFAIGTHAPPNQPAVSQLQL